MLKSRHNHHNEQDGESGSQRYLITYADLITLLLGLFVILYASAQVDESKFKEYSDALSKVFATGKGVLEGGEGVLEGGKKALPQPILPATDAGTEEISERIETTFAGMIQNGTMTVRREPGGLALELSEKLMFPSAKSELLSSGNQVLDTLSVLLGNLPNPIFIDGHTDSDPIKTFSFESNWHLSAARATAVAYKLIQRGVPEVNLAVRGFGSQRPLVTNDNSNNKSKNRRVEIVIMDMRNDVPSDSGYLDEK